MSFEKNIKKIAEDVNLREADRRVYTEDFQCLRDHVMEILKKNQVFDRVFGGCKLFGSYLDKIKVGKPDEFDVHFEIRLPHHEMIVVHEDEPGHVRLNLAKVLTAMLNEPTERDIYNVFNRFVDNESYLKRFPFRAWLDSLFESGLSRGYLYAGYKLSYSRGGTAFTIFAEKNNRTIKIDLVPAFKFDYWIARKPCPFTEKHCFAVAKPKNATSFSICAPEDEEILISNKNNLKNSLRLIKSLKIREQMPRLKSYFIKAVYLLELDKKEKNFWDKPIGEIFVHVINHTCLF